MQVSSLDHLSLCILSEVLFVVLHFDAFNELIHLSAVSFMSDGALLL